MSSDKGACRGIPDGPGEGLVSVPGEGCPDATAAANVALDGGTRRDDSVGPREEWRMKPEDYNPAPQHSGRGSDGPCEVPCGDPRCDYCNAPQPDEVERALTFDEWMQDPQPDKGLKLPDSYGDYRAKMERERVGPWLRHQERCATQAWFKAGPVPCTCGLDEAVKGE